MEKIKQTIRDNLYTVALRAGGELSSDEVDEYVDSLYGCLLAQCTDLTPKEDYPRTCAYCSRPAMEPYG